MQYHIETDTYVQEGVPFTVGDIQYPANWFNLTTAEEKQAHGFIEVTFEGVPEDQSLFYTHQERVGGVITTVNTPKSDEQVKQVKTQQIVSQIQKLESEITPRRLREAILGDSAWLKTKDAEIDDLRKQLTKLNTQ